MRNKAMSRFCVEIFFSHSTEKLRRVTVLCCTENLVSNSSLDKKVGRVGGSIKIFRQTILCRTDENFRRGTFLC